MKLIVLQYFFKSNDLSSIFDEDKILSINSKYLTMAIHMESISPSVIFIFSFDCIICPPVLPLAFESFYIEIIRSRIRFDPYVFNYQEVSFEEKQTEVVLLHDKLGGSLHSKIVMIN